MILALLAFGCVGDDVKSSSVSDLDVIDGMEIRWFGVTTLSIRFADKLWLFDPFFSRPDNGELSPNTKGENAMVDALGPQVDRIFIGHAHYDHALDAGVASSRYDAPVYGSQTTCYLLEGRDCEVLTNGGQMMLDGVLVTAIRTPHWRPDWNGVGSFEELDEPSDNLATAPNGGLLSYHMVFPDGQVLFYQDSMGGLDVSDGSLEDYRENLGFVDSNPIDLWLTCGDCLTDASELQDYVTILQPSVVIPIHWDGLMPDTDQDPEWTPDEVWNTVMTEERIETRPFVGYGSPLLLNSFE